jgi:DNA adenine methylase
MRPPFPYYGGKQLLADRIIDLLPAHQHYVEPYAGSLAVLLAKPRSGAETVNDIDGDLMHFWEILRTRRQELEIACGLTPHSRAEHKQAMDSIREPHPDPVERARRTWVLLTQGRSGGTARRTAWRHFSAAGGGYDMPSYLRAYVARFGPAVARLYGVSLECRPALDVISRYGQHPDAVLYVDPPYVRSTRKGTGYRHEMGDDDHRDLAKALHTCRAVVVLSGYPCDLYDRELYPGWSRFALPAGTGNGGEWRDRAEVIWSNRPLGAQLNLFTAGASS